MKKKIAIFVVVICLFAGASFASTVEVEIVQYGVTVNGTVIDVAHSDYPVIAYNGVTYFPMTFDYLDGIGLTLTYTQADGLKIGQATSSGTISQQFLNTDNSLGSKHMATIAAYPISVNGQVVDNGSEEFPILSYNNITYFPLTWRFAVDEFGWTTGWSNETGFSIVVNQSNDIGISQATTAVDPTERYTVEVVGGGDLSGDRKANVVVDIGFGDRAYYAYTNAYGQLIRVTAEEIILQDETSEPVTESGRYYPDEAKVPGVESSSLDEGHVIADSLGGVANAYNITPQDSTLNRCGDQAYMEKVIRDAIASGLSVTDFVADISYADNVTMIPSFYKFTYKIDGNVISDQFPNTIPNEGTVTGDLSEASSVQVGLTENLMITVLDKKAEEVTIKNISNESVNLKGYRLLSVRGSQDYIFPSYILEPSEDVTVYGKGGTGELEGWASTVWNNSSSDPAELFNSEGCLIYRYED